jgi:hypothetical protein
MRRIASLLVGLSIVLAASLAPGKAGDKTPVFAIDRPTVIAFFPHNAKADKKNSDTNDSLSDFQLYAASARQPLQDAGIDLQVIYTGEFRTALRGQTQTFHSPKAEVGYYLVASGKKPRIEYGVMTDTDLLRIAREYFGVK